MAVLIKRLTQRFQANTITYSGLAALLASVLTGCGGGGGAADTGVDSSEDLLLLPASTDTANASSDTHTAASYTAAVSTEPVV